ncbi:hypothetical protein WJ01_01150 [Burkholderia vietnamiensis]|uniref:YbjN domain-containing protein n=1 Tax=Burkholderia vietnamiensis TaxID=60552 RepID=UPI00075514FF|nr:hypothetical protein [Burkholderia vietnamiensis]KVE90623.1 hypothetical protein WJ01_01150 [Burkholderia vietnamiensis]
MTKIFEESAVNIEALDAHLRDSGVVPYSVQHDCVRLRTERGIGYRIALIADRKFIRISTYIPLSRQAPIDQKYELARRLNEDVFLPVFTIDPDEDLTVAYVLPYTGGLIAGSFVAVVNRFASLLEFVVEQYNADHLIDFGTPTTVFSVADARSGATSGGLY